VPRTPPFDDLERKLLAGGVDPIYVGRTICELQEHHADLVDEGLARGLPRMHAEREAREAIGAEHAIAAAVLSYPELRRWSARHPLIAACGRTLATAAVMPAVPVVYCLYRSSIIARWSAAACLAALFTSSLLLGLCSVLQ
jgi:hypothetical protein